MNCEGRVEEEEGGGSGGQVAACGVVHGGAWAKTTNALILRGKRTSFHSSYAQFYMPQSCPVLGGRRFFLD